MKKSIVFPLILDLVQRRSEAAELSLSISEMTWMAFCLDQYVSDSIDKYIKGQKEHGGNILDRDLDHEIYMESIDRNWYEWARARKEAEARLIPNDVIPVYERPERSKYADDLTE